MSRPPEDASPEKAADTSCFLHSLGSTYRQASRVQAFSRHNSIFPGEFVGRGQMVWRKGKNDGGINMHLDVDEW